MKNLAKISLKKINGFRTALAGIVNKVVHDKKHALFPGSADLVKLHFFPYIWLGANALGISFNKINALHER